MALSSTNTNTTGQTTTLTAEEIKKQERLKKLEAWKKKQADRKKQQEAKPAAVASTAKPKTKLFSLVRKTPVKDPKKKDLKASSLFNSDEENETASKTKLFLPQASAAADYDDEEHIKQDETEGVSMNGDDGELDALDAFMNELEGRAPAGTKDSVASSTQNLIDIEDTKESIAEEDEEEEDKATSILRKLNQSKSKSKSKNINLPKYKLSELEPIVKTTAPVIESITEDDIIDFRAINNIYITNKTIAPILNFYHFGLDANTLHTLMNRFKYTTPTAIQSQTIPAIMTGNDVIGIGKTGSGKTMCYLLGLLKHIKMQRPLSKGESGPLALILSPTRELAIQIHENLIPFLKDSELNAICCTGGSELQTQITELKKGVEIIIATPGRFIDLLTLNGGRLLSPTRISFVTLDEADRLFDLGFEPQITQIMKTIRPDKQTVLFSATFPKKLQQFATKSLNRAISIGVGDKQEVNPNVTQEVKYVDTEYDKFQSLLHILGQMDSSNNEKCIIFCESQTQVNNLSTQLQNRQYTVVAIHAGLTPIERTNNLQRFKKSSSANILIATEVLSRGLDVPSLSLVLLFNPAKTFAQYVHSTGRTGRGDAKGTAISLICKGEALQSYIVRKFIIDEESIPEEIKEMATLFEKDLKDGKVRVNLGYGGKGLERLDQAREEDHHKQQADGAAASSTPQPPSLDTELTPQQEQEVEEQLNLEVAYENHVSVFKAKLVINDLPQQVRWLATNNTALNKIVDETGTSITYKGQYVPPGTTPDKGVEKLYLLIEAKEPEKVKDGVRLCQSFILDGLKKEQANAGANRGKFTM
ncbi:hypothetical protein WICPIJ_006284 [Wickerhamomyces pijperi]|uniref:RNA helicase n=1 Tax=Wickerhamomyces pijperi TaxID=599730 RepID=A0A9P8Q4K4_WICPI|nr:hypothetical protein WICPIJ_006284 [Wickerhamomyces pijperi]